LLCSASSAKKKAVCMLEDKEKIRIDGVVVAVGEFLTFYHLLLNLHQSLLKTVTYKKELS
jgi:hypothetical protein